MLEWSAYSSDLNQVENICTDKSRINWEVIHVKKCSLLSQILRMNWVSCLTHLDSIIGDTIWKELIH